MKNKKDSLYEVDKVFYGRLVIYFTLTLILLFLITFFVIGFAYVADIDISGLSKDVCNPDSSSYSAFLCYLSSLDGNTFYYVTYNFFAIGLTFMLLAFLVLNIFYIANKFYYKKLLKEKSCGAVIFKIEDKVIYYLVLKMGYGHTSLCKGHQENNETDEETALREIKEETNLDVDLNSDFSEFIKYKPTVNSIKTVRFYLATPIRAEEVPIDLHDDEVSSMEWCTYNDALLRITHQSDRRIVKKANRYIKKHYFIEDL